MFFSLDVQIKVHHGFGNLLAGVGEDLDQLSGPEFVTLLEESVSRPLPACSASPADPVNKESLERRASDLLTDLCT